jgi:hypothetical protein
MVAVIKSSTRRKRCWCLISSSLSGDQVLHAAKEMLVLDLFVAEPDQGFQLGLIAKPMILAQLQDLGIHIALQQAEHVGIGAALNLADKAHLLRRQVWKFRSLGKPVGKKAMRGIKASAFDDVLNAPTHPLGHLDATGIAEYILIPRDGPTASRQLFGSTHRYGHCLCPSAQDGPGRAVLRHSPWKPRFSFSPC